MLDLGGFMGGGGGYSLSSSDMASYSTGPVQTGSVLNFSKPASAGLDLNISWLLAALALGAVLLLRKGGA